MKWKLITLMISLLLTSIASAFAQVSVEDDNIIITADKETYFCQPITSNNGCLIQTKITVENQNNFPINAFLEFDADKEVKIRQFRNKGQQIATQSSKGKNLHSNIPYLIPKGTTETYDIEFYTHEDGKFNFSVFYSGKRVILDPFFNTTFNNTNPTLHLDSGRVTTFNDSQFLIVTNITNELNDGSDATRFETSRTQFTNNALLSFLYQGTTSFFGEVQTRGDGSNASNNLDGASRYYEVNVASPLINGDQIEIHMQDNVPPSASLSGIFITNTAQDTFFAKFDTQPTATTYFLDLANINTTASSFRIWANASEDTGDDEIVDLVRVSETIEGQALRVSFPIVINTDNQYFLNVKKTSAGVEDFQVMHYLNNTDAVGEFIRNTTFSSGFNNIQIFPERNDTASFRVFSAVIEEISEIHLIEIIEDTEAPQIQNFSVSPTLLSCFDTVTFEINATDDNFVDTVEVSFNVSSGSIITKQAPLVSGNTFRTTHEYDFLDELNSTYNLLNITVTDLAGQETSISPNTPYNYLCNDTSLLPPSPPEDEFSLSVCPVDTIPRTMLFMFMFLIGFIIIIIGFVFRNGLIGLIGGMEILFMSFFMFACSFAIAVILLGFALFVMTFFTVKGVSGRL